MLKRQKQISLRLTEQEYALLCKKAKAAYLKREPYVRHILDECQIVVRRPDEYLQLAADISVVGKRINEIAHTVNSNWYVTEAQMNELQMLLEEILQMVKTWTQRPA
ncbi:MAG: hypothetical protein HDT26_02530 [Subdoligranulum sp.]|nr:hypothetical protein [Subdoligranulum sp.]